jgi:SAM-dependent methyltransferase
MNLPGPAQSRSPSRCRGAAAAANTDCGGADVRIKHGRDRDVAAFGERAHGYGEGWRMHHQIADRTADLVLTWVPAPKRILDVGCGTGYLLGRLTACAPQAEILAGIDAAPAMIEVATAAAADDRPRFVVGAAERLPWPASTFDLVVSMTSFDHWADQRAGLAECARVLAPGGCLVLADLFSALLPTLLTGRRTRHEPDGGQPAG